MLLPWIVTFLVGNVAWRFSEGVRESVGGRLVWREKWSEIWVVGNLVLRNLVVRNLVVRKLTLRKSSREL